MKFFLKPQRHKDTKKKCFKNFVSLCLCGSTLFLHGCSLLGVGEAEYACDKPGKGICKSARQVIIRRNGRQVIALQPEISEQCRQWLPPPETSNTEAAP